MSSIRGTWEKVEQFLDSDTSGMTSADNNARNAVTEILGSSKYKTNQIPEAPIYYIVPHQGNIDELVHTHSEFSDGNNILRDMAYEAMALGMDYFAPTDHLDLTGISNQEHQGPWLGYFSENLEYRKNSINEIINDLDSQQPKEHTDPDMRTIKVGRGAEIDFDPKNSGLLKERTSNLDMDYSIFSVHHDRNGIPIKSPQITADQKVDKKAQEYADNLRHALDIAEETPKVVALAHPGRAEEGPLEQAITPEFYHPIIEHANDAGIAYELNTKVHLRYFLNKGELPSEFEALATYEGELPPISIATDTHRIGHSETYRDQYKALRNTRFPQIDDNYRITESQMRLQFAEELLQEIANRREEEIQPITLLKGLDLPTVEVPENAIPRKAV